MRTPYDGLQYKFSVASGLACEEGSSMAKQEFKDECDINVIAVQYGIGEKMPEGVKMPQFGDFTSVYDFHSACNAVATARENFELIPAKVRARFRNDPQELMAFLSRESSLDEAIELGLIPEEVRARKAAEKAVSVNPQASPPAGGVHPPQGDKGAAA